MRKSNSVFKTAFVSESGAELANNDYFAFVEFDDFACYVLASGITDFETSAAAKEVVEHLILSFEEKPSMSKSTLLQYMRETNARLLMGSHARRLKASVIMVVTDYEKFRYVSAGNVRLRMYRQGRFFLASSDMSLANDLVKKGDETPLDRHEERHNLYAYLGKKDFFKPFVSKVQKLEDSDIILLYSQGLWENVDAQEIDEIIEGATDDPQASVDTLEDVLLSRQPQDLKSYTAAAIFVNKIYRDPERERKRLFYIKIAIGVVVVLIIIGIIAYIVHVLHQRKVEQLEKTKLNMTEYIQAENYKRAQESCSEALVLAKDLRSKDDETDLGNNLILLDNIVQANEFLNAGNYYSAYDIYLNALKHSVATNKNVRDYIQRRLNIIETRMNMDEFMNLGDSFFSQENYDEAENMYLKASEKATAIHDADARAKAFAAIEKIYAKRADLRKAATDKMNDQKQVALSDAMKKGDDLLAAGDLDGARKAYLDARNLSDDPAARTQTSQALGEVAKAQEKKDSDERTLAETKKKDYADAEQIEKNGDDAFDKGDYISAQMFYMRAIEKYNALFDADKAKLIQSKYDIATGKFTDSEKQKSDAEAAAKKALEYYANKNYPEAKAAATSAKKMFTDLGLQTKADEMDILLQQIATDEVIAASLK